MLFTIRMIMLFLTSFFFAILWLTQKETWERMIFVGWFLGILYIYVFNVFTGFFLLLIGFFGMTGWIWLDTLKSFRRIDKINQEIDKNIHALIQKTKEEKRVIEAIISKANKNGKKSRT